MVTVSIKHNMDDVVRMLSDTQRRQVPFATANAITKTAKLVQAGLVAEMAAKFDRPTPTVMKSTFVEPAKKNKLFARVLVKDRPLGKNPNSMAEILAHEFAGGARKRKRIEMWFERAGMISGNEYLAPGAAAKLDRYGNMNRWQIVQIMSQLALGADKAAWKSGSVRSKRSVARAGEMFWSRGGHLARGVWLRKGRSVSPILMVISQPTYARRINLDAITQRIVDRDFARLFRSSMDEAFRTAR